MEDNLFTKMESYAKENYITEIFSYLLSTNTDLKKKFLKILVSKSRISKYEKKRLKKKFSPSKILTQSHYEKEIIDLEMNATWEKIFIEVKTKSNEGDKQVQKYLDLNRGYVAYLTPSGYDSPKISRNKQHYLGHFFWDEISKLLKDLNSGKSDILDQFLNYLEVNCMTPLNPLKKEEINSGKLAFDFIEKSKSILEKIKSEIEQEWEEYFGRNKGKKGVTFEIENKDINWWFRAKTWKKSGLWLQLGILQEDDKRPQYYVEICNNKQSFFKKLDSEERIRKKFKLLKRWGWERSDDASELRIGKYCTLFEGSLEKIVKKLLRKTRKAIKELRCQEVQLINLLERRQS